MIEVEIRAKVNDFDIVKKRLKNMNTTFLKKEEQEDLIFGNEEFLDSNKMIIDGGLVARIRKIGENIFLEFKEIKRKSGGFEISSKIANKKHGLLLLEKLHFKESFTISKKREIFSYKDFVICLDKVNELGSFIEIEKEIFDESKKNEARIECTSLLKKLDERLTVENRKYGDMIQEIKNGTV